MIIVSAQDIFVRQVNQRVSGTGVSPVAQLQLDHYFFTGGGCLGPANVDRPGVVITGFDPAVWMNTANFDDIAPVGALPAAHQRPEIGRKATVNKCQGDGQKQSRNKYEDCFFHFRIHVLAVAIDTEIASPNTSVKIYKFAQRIYLGNKN